MPQRLRTLMITPCYTLLDGPDDDSARACRQTPADTWTAGLGGLLDRLAAVFDGSGVVLLDGAAAHALKLPAAESEQLDEGIEHAKAAGWQVGSTGAWNTFYRDGAPVIHVGVLPMIDPRRVPLINTRWHQDTVFSFARWHELAGVAWRGTPGVVAMALMRDTMPTYLVAGRKTSPTRKMTEGPEEAAERDYATHLWSRPALHPYEHGYDLTRMYLAAAGTCEHLAPWKLRHTGRRPFDAKLAGWWKVELGAWNEDRIPAPAGPGDPTRWVTTPTLALLSELQRSGGPFQTYEVIDSWTCQGKRILRSWAERIEGVYTAAKAGTAGPDPDLANDAERVRTAAKAVYREGVGMLARYSNTIARPDWHHAIIGQARSNLWRKVWRIGQAENRWPASIDVDNVWYGSDDEDPLAGKPAGVELADKLGAFKVKGTKGLTR